MTATTAAWLVIVVTGIVTFAIRGSFLLIASRLAELSPSTRALLRMIPAASLAALAGPALLRNEGELVLLGPRPLAGLLALAVAWWSRSVLATLVVGLLAVVALELLLA